MSGQRDLPPLDDGFRARGVLGHTGERDRIADLLRAVLPAGWAYRLSRWKNVALQAVSYRLARRFPGFVGNALLKQAAAHLGPGFDVEAHFRPSYDPWTQRLCLVPDADLFVALREGRASVVTDRIDRFTANGVRLCSGRVLEADLIVTATGLEMQPLGGVGLAVDGRAVDLASVLSYRGVMFSGVPNLAAVFGYVNASWTLKADLACAWVCRVLNAMDSKGARQVTPTVRGDAAAAPFVEDFSPNYIRRALDRLPKQGRRPPWRARQDYLRDVIDLRWRRIEDDALVFSSPGAPLERARS